MKKIIFHIYTDMYDEYDWFFNEDCEMLAYWSLADAYWRQEYMHPLLSALGFAVVGLPYDKANRKIQMAITRVLKEEGATKADFKRER